jgi:peptidylprolyl isomerase
MVYMCAKIETSKGPIIVALDYQKHLLLSLTLVTLAEGKNDFVTNDNLKAKPFMMD